MNTNQGDQISNGGEGGGGGRGREWGDSIKCERYFYFHFGFFFQAAIFPLVYVANFSGQLYFWSLLQSNYFDRKFFQSSYFFRADFFFEVTFSQQLFFQNSNIFRAKPLPASYFSRIGSSFGQLVFRNIYFLV